MSLKSHFLDELADPYNKEVYAHVLGSADPDDLTKLLSQPLKQVGFVPARVLFSAVSVGAVFGVEDASGQKLVLKIFPKVNRQPELQQVVAIQKQVEAAGFPAPRLRGDLLTLSPGLHGVLMDYVEGEEADGHDPAIRRELAKYLARFAELSVNLKLPLVKNAFAVPAGDIWPLPHKPGIDLHQKVHGSGWLTKRVARTHALIQQCGLPLICAHGDWGVKNARFRQGRLVTVFDWDSLAAMSEAEMVGRAAAQFTAHWGIETKLVPSPEETDAFISEYESCRGRVFTRQERQVAAAAGDWIIAVIARFGLQDGFSKKNNEFYVALRKGTMSMSL